MAALSGHLQTTPRFLLRTGAHRLLLCRRCSAGFALIGFQTCNRVTEPDLFPSFWLSSVNSYLTSLFQFFSSVSSVTLVSGAFFLFLLVPISVLVPSISGTHGPKSVNPSIFFNNFQVRSGAENEASRIVEPGKEQRFQL